MSVNIFNDGYEFVDNSGMLDQEQPTNAQLMAIVDSEIEELRNSLEENNAVETLDGIIDSIVTLVTLAYRCDHAYTQEELEGAWKEIQRSNMTKTIDPLYVDGKLQKGLYYTPPNLSKVLFG